MKKIISLIFIITFISATLFGCSNEEMSKTGLTKVASYYQYTENAYQPYWGHSNWIKKVENGYYYFNSERLYFFDTTSKKSFLLCFSPSCTHSDAYCNGYFGSFGKDFSNSFMTLGLEVTDSYLYVVVREESEMNDFYLYRINKDGTKREKLFYLYSTDSNWYMYLYTMHEKYLYGNFPKNEKNYDDGFYFGKYGLENNQTEMILDVNHYYGVDLSDIAGYGEFVYFSVTGFEDEEQTKLVSKIYRYHIHTNALEIVFDDFICNKFQLVDDTTMVFMDFDYNILKKDLETGEETLIIPTPGEFFSYSFDGLYLYTQFEHGEDIKVYNLEGNEIDSIEVNDANVFFGDTDYLFVQFLYESTEVEIGNEFNFYALPKEQIGSSNKKWIVLEEVMQSE